MRCFSNRGKYRQVASQTVKSLYVINESVEMPIFRPLIAMDKVDIVNLAKEMEPMKHRYYL